PSADKTGDLARSTPAASGPGWCCPVAAPASAACEYRQKEWSGAKRDTASPGRSGFATGAGLNQTGKSYRPPASGWSEGKPPGPQPECQWPARFHCCPTAKPD